MSDALSASPHNIQNIQYFTSSSYLGIYQEIVLEMSFMKNWLHFVEAPQHTTAMFVLLYSFEHKDNARTLNIPI